MIEQEKKLIDTYETMSDDERAELILIKKIRNNIKYFVGIDILIDKIKEIIENSEYFSFANERSKKYISKTKPLFIVSPNYEKIENEHELLYRSCDQKEYFIGGRTNDKFTDDINYLQKLAHDEIVKPYSDYLMTFLKDNDKFNEILKKNGLEKINLDKSIINLVTMTSVTMFSIKVDMVGNKVYLEYAI
jgi:hypothetical protein